MIIKTYSNCMTFTVDAGKWYHPCLPAYIDRTKCKDWMVQPNRYNEINNPNGACRINHSNPNHTYYSFRLLGVTNGNNSNIPYFSKYGMLWQDMDSSTDWLLFWTELSQ